MYYNTILLLKLLLYMDRFAAFLSCILIFKARANYGWLTSVPVDLLCMLESLILVNRTEGNVNNELNESFCLATSFMFKVMRLVRIAVIKSQLSTITESFL